MTKARWTQIAGLFALGALTLHGLGALAHHYDAGHCVFCHFQHVLVLQPDLVSGDLPTLLAAGCLAEEPAPPVAEPPQTLHPSRGPPA